jgi:hypothetical protein
MARYKRIDTSPRFLAVDLQRQRFPGSLNNMESGTIRVARMSNSIQLFPFFV